MAAALYSLARGIPPRKGFAMTGELTLTGRVMPIGGVKREDDCGEAREADGADFPEDNRKDFEELPPHVRRGLKPHYVRMFSDVVALLFAGEGKRAAGKAVGANRPLKKRPTRRSALH